MLSIYSRCIKLSPSHVEWKFDCVCASLFHGVWLFKRATPEDTCRVLTGRESLKEHTKRTKSVQLETPCLLLLCKNSCSPPGSSLCGVLPARMLSELSFPFQGIFLTQESNLCLLYCRRFFIGWATKKPQNEIMVHNKYSDLCMFDIKCYQLGGKTKLYITFYRILWSFTFLIPSFKIYNSLVVVKVIWNNTLGNF